MLKPEKNNSDASGGTGNVHQQNRPARDRREEWGLRGAYNVTSPKVTKFKNKFSGAE